MVVRKFLIIICEYWVFGYVVCVGCGCVIVFKFVIKVFSEVMEEKYGDFNVFVIV